MTELLLLGISVGLLSGFFGMGGGTVLIPILLLLGYATKDAIGISVIQMLFSSTYGSYINNKKGTLDVSLVLNIGIGGFIGGFFSGSLTSNISDETLEIIFLIFVIFVILRMFFKSKEHKEQRALNKYLLFIIGFLLGAISMTIGVGGSILLVPILVGFLHVDIKKAISAGLFFVVFSSVSGLVSHAISRHIDFQSGVVIGMASLIGVYIGIILKDKVESTLQKKLLVGFYLLIVIYLFNRVFI